MHNIYCISFVVLHPLFVIILGLYSLNERTSCRQISYCSEIWQASRQRCCWGACQILDRLEKSHHKSRGFKTTRHLAAGKTSVRLENRCPGWLLLNAVQNTSYCWLLFMRALMYAICYATLPLVWHTHIYVSTPVCCDTNVLFESISCQQAGLDWTPLCYHRLLLLWLIFFVSCQVSYGINNYYLLLIE